MQDESSKTLWKKKWNEVKRENETNEKSEEDGAPVQQVEVGEAADTATNAATSQVIKPRDRIQV